MEQPKAVEEWGVEDGQRVWYDASGKRWFARFQFVREGKIPLTALTDEELRQGQLRNVDGGWAGAPPTLPSAFRSRINAELLRRGQNRLVDRTGDLVQRLLQIATESPDEAVAVRAATDLLDRAGLAKQQGKQEIAVEHKFEQTLARSQVVIED